MKCIIRTFTGKEVNPLDLRPDDICLEDIAHALSLCNRFAGHTKKPISVAQHSVYVSRLLEDDGIMPSLQGLLHDASEAYLGDMTKWLKQTPEMEAFREAEFRTQNRIYEKFSCPSEPCKRLDWADRVMVRFEGRKGFGPDFAIDNPNYPELTLGEFLDVGAWAPWSWKTSEEAFLTRYRLLTHHD